MKKILIIVFSIFLVIILANVSLYKGLYKKQTNYIVTLLDRQVQMTGFAVDSINNFFISNLNEISYSEDLGSFFTEPENQKKVIDRMKVFYLKYSDFITDMKLYDNKRNEFTLKMDEKTGEWLEQPFVLHLQGEIFEMEKLVEENKKFGYYLPVIEENNVVGNLVVTVDYRKYFNAIFSGFRLKEYQWQWVVNESGNIIYDNSGSIISYEQIDKITAALESGSVGNLIHYADVGMKKQGIISSYYSTQLLQRDLGLIFSAPTGIFRKYIVRNSLFIIIGTILSMLVVIYLFLGHLKEMDKENKYLRESEKILLKLVEEMPAGIMIHNKKGEILIANKAAANYYSYQSGEEMKGKTFPETSMANVDEYFSKNLGNVFKPEQIVILRREGGELFLYRNSIPIVYMGEEADMEILIDVTMLESARKQEVKANIAKSEFMTRMNYELRTPLNVIIGMTDILARQKLTNEVRAIADHLRRSTEILLNIINDFIDFSKIEAGKMLLNEIPFNLREEIEYCTNLARTSISDKKITVTNKIDDDVPVSIIADHFRLRQVLTNLINHSVSNTEKGEIQLKCRQQSNNDGIVTLVFELLDTGKAFDQENLNKIFGKFINIELKVAESDDESFFGPIVAHQLIDLMGGEMTAVCPSGLSGEKGTKIVFTIPVFSNDRMEKSLNLERIKSFDSVKTLVVTGQQTRDEELLGSLHRLGLNISVTTCQKSTVGQIKASLASSDDRYDMMVILDDEDFNGFEFARSIWENNLSGNLIIMMISSSTDKGNYRKSISLGIDNYFVKPVDTVKLGNAIMESFPFIESNTAPDDISRIKSGIRILVVEDNIMNQQVICTMLRILGYSSDIAKNGNEAWLMARDNKYDMIFMDLILPELDGYESARKILAEYPEILIVALTADNMQDARRKAELSGIEEFIVKPVRIEDLKLLFAKYFEKN